MYYSYRWLLLADDQPCVIKIVIPDGGIASCKVEWYLLCEMAARFREEDVLVTSNGVEQQSTHNMPDSTFTGEVFYYLSP